MLVFHSSRVRKDGLSEVKIKVIFANRKPLLLSTSIFVRSNQFKDQRIVQHDLAQRYNAELSRQLYKLQSLALDYIRKNGKITPTSVRAFHKNKSLEFLKLARVMMEANHNLAPSTKRRYRVVFNHIERFDQHIKIDEINYDWLDAFDAYLKKNNVAINSRIGVHKCISTYLNKAAKKGLIEKNDIPKYRLKAVPTDRTALTNDELRVIEQMEFATKEQHFYAVKDIFLFSCYTGLRFQDLMMLTARNFRAGKDGLELHFRALKTSKLLTLPLDIIFNGKPKEIAIKYLSNIQRGRELDKPIFDKITNQYANRCIREIALKAKIYKKVTMHIGRHTFGTLMAMKVSPKILQELMQHSKIETTMIYVHLSNKDINNALKDAFQ